MKKLLLILLCLPFIFTSCKKEEEELSNNNNNSNTQTYIPDDNFEQRLIDLGFDNTLDNYVNTSSIDTVTYLILTGKSISDLTGLEDFINLYYLDCDYNNLTNLDVSANTALFNLDCSDNNIINVNINGLTVLNDFYCSRNNIEILDVSSATSLRSFDCEDNQLISLDIRNGNNINFYNFYTIGNPNLTCINVDDDSYSSGNWTNIDPQHYFSEDCP